MYDDSRDTKKFAPSRNKYIACIIIMVGLVLPPDFIYQTCLVLTFIVLMETAVFITIFGFASRAWVGGRADTRFARSPFNPSLEGMGRAVSPIPTGTPHSTSPCVSSEEGTVTNGAAQTTKVGQR